MPVRVRAKPPGEFIRDHLVDVGGMDYPQAIHRAYKAHLKAQGLRNGTCRETMSKYIWLANKMGLIVFDHADEPAYWNGIIDGVEVPDEYVRESRPQAPSPRHYYRIVDAGDPRWVRLETSYRESIGIEVPPPFPRVPVPAAPPKVEKKPPKPKPKPAKPAAPPKPPRKPRVVAPKPPTPRERVAPLIANLAEIAAKLDSLESAPALARVDDFSEELITLGEQVVERAEKARGTERTILGNLNLNIRAGLDHLNLLRTSVTRVLEGKTTAEKERARTALRAAVRVVQEDLAFREEAGGEE